MSNVRANSLWRFDFWNVDMSEGRREARAALAAAGFSVGRRQRGSPAGILFGDFDIMKWRNLRPADRDALHGLLHEDTYPIRACFPSGLPDEIDDALLAMNDQLAAKRNHTPPPAAPNRAMPAETEE